MQTLALFYLGETKFMIEIIRRLFVVILWMLGITVASVICIGVGEMMVVAEGDSGGVLMSYIILAVIFFAIIGITYLIHKKILNYIFVVDKKKSA